MRWWLWKESNEPREEKNWMQTHTQHFPIREWIIIWVPLLTLVGCCCCCYQPCSLCDVCSAHNPDVTISVQYGFILLPRQIYEGRKKNIQWEGRQVVCESISVDICLLLRDSVLFIYKPFVIQYDLFPFFFKAAVESDAPKTHFHFFDTRKLYTHTHNFVPSKTVFNGEEATYFVT